MSMQSIGCIVTLASHMGVGVGAIQHKKPGIGESFGKLISLSSLVTSSKLINKPKLTKTGFSPQQWRTGYAASIKLNYGDGMTP